MKRVLLLLSLLLLAYGGTPPNLDSPGHPIVCLGDSITAGLGVAAEESYPARLTEQLGQPVVNAGVSGEAAADGLAVEQRTHAPKCAVLCILGTLGYPYA